MSHGTDYGSHLFLQLAVILITGRLCGPIVRKFGQTSVIGEMIAGILLGPSLLGLVWPSAETYLFPPSIVTGVAGSAGKVLHPSMAIIFGLSRLGLVLYMYLIGLEFDVKQIASNSRKAFVISIAGIVVPVIAGGALGMVLAPDTRLFEPHVAYWQAGLFMAAGMSVTAFPVLVRILDDMGIKYTAMGVLVIGMAAVNDIAAWSLLACMKAITGGGGGLAVAAALGDTLLYALIIFVLHKSLFKLFAVPVGEAGPLSPARLISAVVTVCACSWIGGKLGLHPAICAFACGLAMPRGLFGELVAKALSPLVVSVLVPVFFVYSGLSTNLAILLNPSLLSLAVVVTLVAIVCKAGGCMGAARSTGMSWRDSASIGALMNARGLMELILINIAREDGFITQGLFTIMVLMTLITTVAASPLYRWINREQPATA